MTSFDDAILDEPKRFIGYAFQNNPKISDWGEFKSALNEGIAHGKGDIDEQTIINLFENSETKHLIKSNVSNEEYEKLYGDGELDRRIAISPKKMVVIKTKKSHTKRYKRSGIVIHGYNRGYRRWSPAEAKFLSIRKKRKLAPQQIISEYNQHFKAEGRTSSSIKTKIFRI